MALVEKDAPIAVEGIKSRFRVSTDGGEFVRLRGGNSITYDAAERQASTIDTFEGVVSVLTAPGINPINVTIPGYMPHIPPMPALQTAYDNNEDVSLEILTAYKPTPIVATLAGRTATLSDDGVFEIAAVPSSETQADVDALFVSNIVRVGYRVVLGTDTALRYITSIKVDDDVADGGTDRWSMTVLPAPDADLTAATFQILFPRLKILTAAGVQKIGSINLGSGADGTLSTDLSFLPNTPLRIPQPTADTTP